MKQSIFSARKCVSALVFLLSVTAISAFAQTTAFTYQGRFTDATVSQPTNGNYDFQFTLYDAVSGGTQPPQPTPITVTRTGLTVANGIFSTTLDFGSAAFTGADRFLEIAVKKPTDASYATLTPRQQITSAPLAIRSRNGGTLIRTTAESFGANCSNGGVKLEFGIDQNGNGILETSEVDAAQTRYVCKGEVGLQGPNGAQGIQGPVGLQGATGPQGPQGPQGASGTSGAYGDGSAGAFNVASGQTIDLTTAAGIAQLPSGFNLQFSSINVSGTLIVPSGTKLRSTGDVTVTGTITVAGGAPSIAAQNGNQGISLRPSASYENGIGLSSLAAAQLNQITPASGGGSGARVAAASGGEGGGSFAILAQGNIRVITGGAINANGANGVNPQTAGLGIVGTGGGAGGVITLLAKGTIALGGTIRAAGGNGADGFNGNGGSGEGGGGGGGGIVRLIAGTPFFIMGSVVVSGGTAGANAFAVSPSSTIIPGNGGGASGGNGGNGGGTIPGTTTVGNASAGNGGYFLQIVVPIPENLFQ